MNRFAVGLMSLCLIAIPDSGRAVTRPGEVPQSEADTLSFVVLGHLRGDRSLELHYLLDELLGEVQSLEPDFAVLTGDMIWGNPEQTPADRESVLAQWEAFDSALARLDIPIYRVPGNHEMSDQVTYDLYVERYGPLPAVVDRGSVRLLLLNSAWPADEGTPRAATGGRGYDIDADQLRFASEQLTEAGEFAHAFVFVHHLLWWGDADSPWWRTVHPELVRGGVRAVFSGDYGPEKFSHTRRDGIEYYQAAIAPSPSLGILRGHEWNRILAQQFDNFLMVRVAGPDVDVEVRTIGEATSGHFSPDRWREVYGDIRRPPPPTGRDHLLAIWQLPRGRLAIIGGFGLVGAGGVVIGLLIGRRRRVRGS